MPGCSKRGVKLKMSMRGEKATMAIIRATIVKISIATVIIIKELLFVDSFDGFS